MRDRKIIPPTTEKNTTYQQVLKVMTDKSLTSDQVWKKIGNMKLGTIRALLPNMCMDGYLEKVRCESCNVGVKYRRKK